MHVHACERAWRCMCKGVRDNMKTNEKWAEPRSLLKPATDLATDKLAAVGDDRQVRLTKVETCSTCNTSTSSCSTWRWKTLLGYLHFSLLLVSCEISTKLSLNFCDLDFLLSLLDELRCHRSFFLPFNVPQVSRDSGQTQVILSSCLFLF